MTRSPPATPLPGNAQTRPSLVTLSPNSTTHSAWARRHLGSRLRHQGECHIGHQVQQDDAHLIKQNSGKVYRVELLGGETEPPAAELIHQARAAPDIAA